MWIQSETVKELILLERHIIWPQWRLILWSLWLKAKAKGSAWKRQSVKQFPYVSLMLKHDHLSWPRAYGNSPTFMLSPIRPGRKTCFHLHAEYLMSWSLYQILYANVYFATCATSNTVLPSTHLVHDFQGQMVKPISFCQSGNYCNFILSIYTEYFSCFTAHEGNVVFVFWVYYYYHYYAYKNKNFMHINAIRSKSAIILNGIILYDIYKLNNPPVGMKCHCKVIFLMKNQMALLQRTGTICLEDELCLKYCT